MFPVNFVARKMEMDTCFGSVPFHLYRMLGSFLSLLTSCLRIVLHGLVAYSGMAGCLVLVAVVAGVLGLLLLVSWLVLSKNVAWVPIRWITVDSA